MTLFSELKNIVHQNNNSNFYFDRLGWLEQIWIVELCSLLEQKINDNKKIHSTEKSE